MAVLDLLADIIGEATSAGEFAKNGENQASAGLPEDFGDWRTLANGGEPSRHPFPGSPPFATVRPEPESAECEHWCGNSPLSPDSPPVEGGGSRNPYMTPAQIEACHSPAWSEDEIQTYTAVRLHLISWGFVGTRAENFAERLVLRDREGDQRRACAECAHVPMKRCTNWRVAGYSRSEEVLPDTLQNCPGFRAGLKNNQPKSNDAEGV